MLKQTLIAFVLAGGVSTAGHALDRSAPVIKVQAGNVDYRVSLLEEQNRRLLGEIEELKFRLLELQELMRRMQEDNEFRFQQIEEKQGKAPSADTEQLAEDEDGFIRLGKDEPSGQQAETAGAGGQSRETANLEATTRQPPRTIDGVEIYEGEGNVDSNAAGSLGTIEFDADGNIVSSTLGKPLDLTAGLNRDDGQLPENPNRLFQFGVDQVQTGRYEDAERALVAFSDRFPQHPRLPEARFWLGESFLGRGQYRKAAEIYLDSHKRWPNAKYGPQSLLKLGVSVAGMNQRELACATFAEVLQKYPQASRAVRRNVAFEQRAARCAVN